MEKKTYQLYDIPRLLDNPFRLGRIGWMPNHRFMHKHHKLKELFICFVLYGKDESQILINGQEARLVPPYMSVYKPGTLLNTVCPGYHDEIFFCYEPEIVEFWERLGIKTISFKLTPRIEALVNTMKGHLDNLYSPGVVDRIEILVQELVTEVMISGYEIQRKTGNANPKIFEIASYLSLHYTEPLDIEQIWKKYNFSKRTFYREWNKSNLITPVQFVLNLRLAYARELLVSSSHTVQEISSKSGFNSPAYMIQRFHVAYGMTPSEYRRSLEDRAEEVHQIFSR